MSTDYAWIISEKFPNAEWTLDGDDYDGLNWMSTDIKKPTREELDALYLSHKHATEYIIKRRAKYKSWQEQLEMQYDDAINGTTTWIDYIASVKSLYPKPQDL